MGSRTRRAENRRRPRAARSGRQRAASVEVPSLQKVKPRNLEDLLKHLREFVLVIDISGKVAATWTSSGPPPHGAASELLGLTLGEVMDEESAKLVLQCRDRAAQGGADQIEISVPLEDGMHWFVVWIVPVKRAENRFATCCIFARDVTHRKVTHSILEQKRALLSKAHEIGRMGAWEVDAETGEGFWSEEMYKLLGMKPNDPPITRDRFLAMVHPDDRERLAGLPEASAWRELYQEHETRFVLNGQVKTFRTRILPVTDSSGRITRVVGLSEDITERRAVENRLKASEALLAQAEQLANMGSWEWEVGSNTLNWSAQYYRLLGFEPAEGPVPYGSGIATIHPEDLERANSALDALRRTGQPLDIVLRHRRADGEIRILHSRGVGIADAHGRVVHIRGMSQDITEQKQAQKKLERSEALLAQAEELAHLGSWEKDLRTGEIYISPQIRRMYGIALDEEWTGEKYWQRILPEDRERARKISGRGQAERKPWEYAARHLQPNGEVRVYHTRGVPIIGEDGKVIRLTGFVQDITEQTHALEELRRLSQEVMRARDEERRHVARNLHESAGQSLAGLKMSLRRLAGSLPKKDAAAQELLLSCVDLTDAAIREVRTVSYLMHPPLLDEVGLGPALRWYARGFADRSGIDVKVEIAENLGRHSQEIETTLFRVVQEALTNLHRHSGSSTAVILILRDRDHIRAEIQDAGRGLPLADAAKGRRASLGVGIAGMRERVEQLSGRLEIEGAPGRGVLGVEIR